MAPESTGSRRGRCTFRSDEVRGRGVSALTPASVFESNARVWSRVVVALVAVGRARRSRPMLVDSDPFDRGPAGRAAPGGAKGARAWRRGPVRGRPAGARARGPRMSPGRLPGGSPTNFQGSALIAATRPCRGPRQTGEPLSAGGLRKGGPVFARLSTPLSFAPLLVVLALVVMSTPVLFASRVEAATITYQTPSREELHLLRRDVPRFGLAHDRMGRHELHGKLLDLVIGPALEPPGDPFS